MAVDADRGEQGHDVLVFVPSLNDVDRLGEISQAVAAALPLARLLVVDDGSTVPIDRRILGVDDPWNQIAERNGEQRKNTLRKLNDIVSRRNDIIHRGDRTLHDSDGDPQSIDVAWVQTHTSAVQSIVLASDQLVTDSMATMTGEIEIETS